MGEATRSRTVAALSRLVVMLPGLLVLVVSDNNASTAGEILVIVAVGVYVAASQYAVTRWLANRKATAM